MDIHYYLFLFVLSLLRVSTLGQKHEESCPGLKVSTSSGGSCTKKCNYDTEMNKTVCMSENIARRVPCQIKTIGGTADEGTPCAFPFEHGNRTVYKCIRSKDRPLPERWCKTAGDSPTGEMNWGYCATSALDNCTANIIRTLKEKATDSVVLLEENEATVEDMRVTFDLKRNEYIRIEKRKTRGMNKRQVAMETFSYGCIIHAADSFTFNGYTWFSFSHNGSEVYSCINATNCDLFPEQDYHAIPVTNGYVKFVFRNDTRHFFRALEGNITQTVSEAVTLVVFCSYDIESLQPRRLPAEEQKQDGELNMVYIVIGCIIAVLLLIIVVLLVILILKRQRGKDSNPKKKTEDREQSTVRQENYYTIDDQDLQEEYCTISDKHIQDDYSTINDRTIPSVFIKDPVGHSTIEEKDHRQKQKRTPGYGYEEITDFNIRNKPEVAPSTEQTATKQACKVELESANPVSQNKPRPSESMYSQSTNKRKPSPLKQNSNNSETKDTEGKENENEKSKETESNSDMRSGSNDVHTYAVVISDNEDYECQGNVLPIQDETKDREETGAAYGNADDPRASAISMVDNDDYECQCKVEPNQHIIIEPEETGRANGTADDPRTSVISMVDNNHYECERNVKPPSSAVQEQHANGDSDLTKTNDDVRVSVVSMVKNDYYETAQKLEETVNKAHVSSVDGVDSKADDYNVSILSAVETFDHESVNNEK